MGLFDNFYGGFNPNMIQSQTPVYPQQRLTVTGAPMSSPTAVELPRVNGYDGAVRFPLGPNSRIALFDANEDIMYIKQTDAGGYPTVTKYRFILDDNQTKQNSQFVTVDEFNKFKEEVLNGQQFIRESAKSGSGNKNGQSKRNSSDV